MHDYSAHLLQYAAIKKEQLLKIHRYSFLHRIGSHIWAKGHILEVIKSSFIIFLFSFKIVDKKDTKRVAEEVTTIDFVLPLDQSPVV